MVDDILLPESCSATMLGEFAVGDFRGVWTYPDFARGLRKSEGDHHKKAGGLIVDLGWVQQDAFPLVCCPAILGLERIGRMMIQEDCCLLRRFLRGNRNDDNFCRRICGRLCKRRVSASQLPTCRLFLRVGSGWLLGRRWFPLFG